MLERLVQAIEKIADALTIMAESPSQPAARKSRAKKKDAEVKTETTVSEEDKDEAVEAEVVEEKVAEVTYEVFLVSIQKAVQARVKVLKSGEKAKDEVRAIFGGRAKDVIDPGEYADLCVKLDALAEQKD